MTSARISCSVCYGELEAHTEAYCNSCGQPYHLNQRTDLPGRDCGQVWIHEEHLSLEFACNPCLNPAPSGALDEIVDLAEAAALAGMSEPEIMAAAEAGLLSHRRVAGSVLLFERAQVVAFGQGKHE